MLVAWGMNQHLSLYWVSQPNLLNLRFNPLPSPLPRREGIMTLKPTIIGFSAICPLSPRERARERANRNNLKKTSSEKDGNTKIRMTQTPKRKT